MSRSFNFFLRAFLFYLLTISPLLCKADNEKVFLQTHSYFENNRYLYIDNVYVINDSLEFLWVFPEAVRFISDELEIQEYVQSQETDFMSDNILLIGDYLGEYSFNFHVSVNRKTTDVYPIEQDDNKKFACHNFEYNNNKYTVYVSSKTVDKSDSLKVLIASFSNSFYSGEGYLSNLPPLHSALRDIIRTNRFLRAYETLSNYPDYILEAPWPEIKFQMKATLASFLGDFDNYTLHVKRRERLIDSDIEFVNKVNEFGFKNNKAFELIKLEAKNRNIIMFNEDHSLRHHRKLIHYVLPLLKDLGYTYFAIEALTPGGEDLLNNGYPVSMETGFYIFEQNFSNLIRLAQKLGYNFVAYDYGWEQEGDRPLMQATNIFNKTLKVDSTAKVIVLAGGGHIRKKPDRSGKKWMAAILKETFSVDPLSIAQTGLNRYRGLLPDSVILINNSYFSNHYLNSFDYLVINNLTKKYNHDIIDSDFIYTNHSKSVVQLNLYLTKEYDQMGSQSALPFFTTTINPLQTVGIKLKEEDYYNSIYEVYDAHGRLVEFCILGE